MNWVSWIKETVIEPWAKAMDDIDNEPRFWAAAILAVVALSVAVAAFATVTVFMFNVSHIVGWFWVASFSYWAVRALWRFVTKETS